MKRRLLRRRLLAGATTTALVVGLGLSVMAPPAQAAPKISVSGNNNLTGGETLRVRVTGFAPSVPVAVGICPTGRKAEGPGDCGTPAKGYAVLTAANASGVVTAELQVPPRGGPLGNTTGPKANCPPCSISASSIGANQEGVTTRLNYASAPRESANRDRSSQGSGSASGGSTGSGSTGGQASSGDAGADTAATTSSADVLADTGPSTTLALGLGALVLIVAGTALRAGVRPARATTGRHRTRV